VKSKPANHRTSAVECNKRNEIFFRKFIYPDLTLGQLTRLSELPIVQTLEQRNPLNQMTARLKAVLILGLVSMVFCAMAQDDQLTSAEIQKLIQGLQYKQGEIKIKDSLATLNVPTNFNYLDASDAKRC
jgi:hypothetical protein